MQNVNWSLGVTHIARRRNNYFVEHGKQWKLCKGKFNRKLWICRKQTSSTLLRLTDFLRNYQDFDQFIGDFKRFIMKKYFDF